MGRKSTKGKEKKMKRKEEQAKIAAAKVKVDAANKLDDPMESLAPPFKKYDRNDLTITIECKKVADLEKDVTDWIFNLVKTNMKSLYEASDWGWKEREKKEELLDEQARYLIAKTADGQLVGFCHFRFDLDFDDEVIYCYEIQLTSEVRRKGLGKYLMQILELLAFRTEMKKVMATVFKDNVVASNFFTKVLKMRAKKLAMAHILQNLSGNQRKQTHQKSKCAVAHKSVFSYAEDIKEYTVDETSPSIYDPMNDEEYCYEILSKPIKVKKAPAAPRPNKALPVSEREVLM